VQLPLFDEPAVCARLIDAAAALDWPRDRLEIQILDDSRDETSAICAAACARLRADGFQIMHLRRADRAGFKAGALEAGRAVARGSFLLVLDADFVPAPSLLRETVGYFADAQVAMVQVRWEHLNRPASLLTETQALLLDGHFAIEQPARAWSGRVCNFNGTAGVWRASAIDDAGGWQHDTLTEDLDLSYRAALRGWRFVYLTRAAAPAELPATMSAFRTQQFRWAKGSVECARKLLPAVRRSRALARPARVEAAFHLAHNVPYLATATMAIAGTIALSSPAPHGAQALHLITAAITALVLGAYAIGSQRALGRRALPALARVPAMAALTVGISLGQARAVIEGALGVKSSFVRTPKDGAIGRTRAPRVRRRRARWRDYYLEAICALGATAAAIHAGLTLATVALALFAIGWAWVALATALDR
ncbi:MAG TPA: glycosyltransferase, partial [Kofleriaceae bacterium]|nr:glycosyltransferase [Kofleriaceae bacterium]